jgi:hypothetical protein
VVAEDFLPPREAHKRSDSIGIKSRRHKINLTRMCLAIGADTLRIGSLGLLMRFNFNISLAILVMYQVLLVRISLQNLMQSALQQQSATDIQKATIYQPRSDICPKVDKISIPRISDVSVST